MSPVKIIAQLVKFILYVGIAGGLVDLTHDMMLNAGRARRFGLVSLSSINHALGM